MRNLFITKVAGAKKNCLIKIVEAVLDEDGATTGQQGFAVCLAHTAKPKLHTAKALPCVAHGKEHTANSFTVNPIFTHGQIMGTRRNFAVSQS